MPKYNYITDLKSIRKEFNSMVENYYKEYDNGLSVRITKYGRLTMDEDLVIVANPARMPHFLVCNYDDFERAGPEATINCSCSGYFQSLDDLVNAAGKGVKIYLYKFK